MLGLEFGLLVVLAWLRPTLGLLPGLYCGDQNCYDVLNITRDEWTKNDLQKSYRNLARKWHPDRHKTDEAKAEAEEKFRIIATAYETLKDDEVRQEYDYLLDNPDEVYRHYWHYYKRRAAPNVDVRLVILATILVISAFQYLSGMQKYREAINYALWHPKYRSQASAIAKERGLIGEAKRKEYRKSRKTKDEIKADEELILKEIIKENIDVKGGYKPPSLKDTLVVHIVFFPYYAYDFVRFYSDWIWRFWIKKEEYGESEKNFLIRKNLGLSQYQYEALDESERAKHMRDELWIKEKFKAWKEAREEEERRKQAESGRAKSYRRYMKNHATQMSFVDEDF